MKSSTLVALLNENLITLQVQFKDSCGLPMGKKYTYKTTDASIEVGDTVVVDAPSTGLTTVVVCNVDTSVSLDKDATWSYKWVVQKVDMLDHNTRIETEQVIIERLMELERSEERVGLIAKLKERFGDKETSELVSLINNL